MAKRDLFFKIKNRADITRWFKAMLKYGLSFHPDHTFDDYVELGTGKRIFTNAEAKKLDRMMADAFQIAGDGVYSIGLMLFRRRLGMKR